MPDKKTTKKERQPYALILGATYPTELGNQTNTVITNPKTAQLFYVTLIWEKQGDAQVAVPYSFHITAGKLDLFNTADIDRRLGVSNTLNNYPLTSTFMRRIPFEKIIDASRKALIENNTFYKENEIPIVHEIYSEQLMSPKRKGRPFYRSDSFYREIAAHYNEAKAMGGSKARKPATHIQQFVLTEIGHLSIQNQYVQIRKWVAESRKRGYISKVERN